MITMTPEILHTYVHAIKKMDPNPDIVTAERGSYQRSYVPTWFEENAEYYTADEMAVLLNITVKSVREKAARAGLYLLTNKQVSHV